MTARTCGFHRQWRGAASGVQAPWVSLLCVERRVLPVWVQCALNAVKKVRIKAHASGVHAMFSQRAIE